MAKRPARPPDMPWLSPYLIVKDADAALDFYLRAFGFEKKMAIPGPNGKAMHAEVRWHDMVVMFGPEGNPGNTSKSPAATGIPSPVGLYVYCDDVDALYARATKAGAKGLTAPVDMFYGDRVCKLADQDGHLWSFATNVADYDPTKAP